MHYLTFMALEFLLFSTFLILNFYFDKFLGSPFTYVDFIAIIVFLGLCFGFIRIINTLFVRFGAISRKVRIILSVVTFILAIIFTAFLDIVWYELFGRMLFV